MKCAAIFVLLAFGCGPNRASVLTPTSSHVVAQPRPVSGVFEVRITVARRGGDPILPNSIVPTGTDFEITIELDEPAHVYVGGISAVGKPYLVLPEPTDSALISAGRHRMPVQPTKWLALEPPSGQELMFVIASRRPLPIVDHFLAQTVGELPIKQPIAPPESQLVTPVAPQVSYANPTAPVRSLVKSTAVIKPPRSFATFTPDLTRTVAMTPRGELRPRRITTKDYGPQRITAPDGLVVYLLAFTHSMPSRIP
jgi:hypothetical protein